MTAIIRTRLSYLFQSTPDVGQGSTILIGCVPKETHEIGALILALFCRRAGLCVSYLGQMVETNSLLQEIRARRPGVVCLSAMTRPRVRDLVAIARAIDRLDEPKPTLCFGGGVFSRNARLTYNIKGFYLGNDVTVAVQHLQRLTQARTS